MSQESLLSWDATIPSYQYSKRPRPDLPCAPSRPGGGRRICSTRPLKSALRKSQWTADHQSWLRQTNYANRITKTTITSTANCVHQVCSSRLSAFILDTTHCSAASLQISSTDTGCPFVILSAMHSKMKICKLLPHTPTEYVQVVKSTHAATMIIDHNADFVIIFTFCTFCICTKI